MSANLDLVRSIYADWERGDFSRMAWADPEIEIEMIGGPEPGVWRGMAGAAEFTRSFLSAWDEVRLVADHHREVDDERVVARVHYGGRGSASGVDLGRMGTEHANLFEIRDGTVTRYVIYWEPENVPADLGLEVMPEKSTTADLAERVRGFVEAINRRDYDAVESFYAQDSVLVGGQVGRFEGAAAIRRLIEDMMKPYDDFHTEIEEITDLGNGVFLTVAINTGHPVGSSGEVRMRFASVGVLANGVVERQTNFMDIDEARAAAERLTEERG